MAKNNEKKPADYRYNNSRMFSVQEAYKTIRTNIVLSVLKDGCKKIVVTSSGPAEGKSTSATNIAIALAQAFNKVLILDCDLRRPRDHKALHVSSNPGISNILSGLSDFEETIQKTSYDNLYIITAGLAVPNPSEMLSSQKMQDLLAQVEQQFDYIIIDTPPINVVSDAFSMIRLSDGVVFVVRNKHTLYTDVDKALESLKFINAKIIGFILNDADNTALGRYDNSRYKKHYSGYYRSSDSGRE